MPGNTSLVNYGIQTEQSDLRAHVCVYAQKVYVYRTPDGVNLIQSGMYQAKPTYTAGIITALGCAVPVSSIPGVASVDIPQVWLDVLNFSERDTPTAKGEKAIKVVKGLLNKGRFPLLPLTVKEVDDRQMQIAGTDIHISLEMKVKIQVKCDYKGGVGDGMAKYVCTGNLYLQTAECNPFGYK